MPANYDRSRRIRAGLTNMERLNADVHAAFNQTEDALTALEDREARRVQRNAASDPRRGQ